jgi:hypothetical protein
MRQTRPFRQLPGRAVLTARSQMQVLNLARIA